LKFPIWMTEFAFSLYGYFKQFFLPCM
jgi:hypothetical protein